MAGTDPLSMSSDNTPEGRMDSDTVEGGPISLVEIGDRVVDAAGAEVGKVKFVKMGDPNAATTEGQEGGDAPILWFGDTYGMGELPEQVQQQLLRVGFIHIDISMARDKFAGAGQIAAVEGNTVHLNVTEDQLI